MSKRYVDLGWGKRVSLGAYVKGWKQAKALPSDLYVKTCPGKFDGGTVKEVLRTLRAGMHDRINRHILSYGQGRKWDSDWQRHAWQASRAVNTPRLVVRWVPREFRARLAHRLERSNER